MKLTNLLTLKQLLAAASDFTEPWEYFFDNFAENPDFAEVGKNYKNRKIKSIIETVGQAMFDKKRVQVTHLHLTLIKKYYFIHGVCNMDGQPVILFYFTDIDKGLLAVCVNNVKMLMARVTSAALDSKSGLVDPSYLSVN